MSLSDSESRDGPIALMYNTWAEVVNTSSERASRQQRVETSGPVECTRQAGSCEAEQCPRLRVLNWLPRDHEPRSPFQKPQASCTFPPRFHPQSTIRASLSFRVLPPFSRVCPCLNEFLVKPMPTHNKAQVFMSLRSFPRKSLALIFGRASLQCVTNSTVSKE